MWLISLWNKATKSSLIRLFYSFPIVQIKFFGIAIQFSFSFSSLLPEKWANLWTYPNFPKFIIDDVIPEVVCIIRSRNPFFWILRSFLRQNRFMCIFLKLVLSYSKTIFSLRYTHRNTWFSERCPRWRHKSDLLGWSVFLNPQKWPTLKLNNFVKN